MRESFKTKGFTLIPVFQVMPHLCSYSAQYAVTETMWEDLEMGNPLEKVPFCREVNVTVLTSVFPTWEEKLKLMN